MSGWGVWAEDDIPATADATGPVPDDELQTTSNAVPRVGVGPVPDDVREAIAAALCKAMGGDDPYLGAWVDAVLSVPAVAAVFARDTQVREIVEDWRINSLTAGWNAVEHITAVATHYPEAADDSDIMPGSEFDGPVVL